jgi:hypothetical protein
MSASSMLFCRPTDHRLVEVEERIGLITTAWRTDAGPV